MDLYNFKKRKFTKRKVQFYINVKLQMCKIRIHDAKRSQSKKTFYEETNNFKIK